MNIASELRALWRYWSVRLAAVFGLVVMWMVSDLTLLPRIVDLVPEAYRPAAGMLAGFLAFALPTIARRIPQADMPQTDKDA